jgi:hypothetical protein
LKLGRYTLAFLEVAVFFAKPPKPASLPKQSAGMMVLGKSEHLVKIDIKDFAEFMLLRTKIWFANTPGAENPELKLGESDVKRFKYLLAYVQEAEKAEIEKLTKLGKRITTTLEKKAKGVWEDASLGGKIGLVALICVPASLIVHSAVMAAKGKPTSLHETVLQGAELLVKEFSVKLVKPKKAANLQTTPYTLKVKPIASPWKQTFKDVSANETEVHGLKLGGSLSFSGNRRIPASAYSSLPALQVQGWSDQRMWYCEKTCEAYRTDELRALYQRNELAAEDTVIELTSEECKQTRLDEIPEVVVPVLFSTTKKKFSVDVEGSTTLSKGLDEVPSRFKVQCTWKDWTLSGEANTLFKDTKNPLLSDPNNPENDKMVTGFVQDLKMTLQRKLLLGLNTSRRTSELDLLASIQDTKETYPVDGLSTHFFTTTAGMTWKVTRKDHRTVSFSLMGSLYDSQLAGGKDKPPDAQFRMEAVSRKLTLFVDTKVQFSGGPELSSLTFRCFYTFGGKQ